MKSLQIKKFLILFLFMAITLSTFASAAEFTDISADHPYKTAIEFCRANGIINGLSETVFAPDVNLTRAQLAVIWCRSLNIITDNPAYTDITKLRSYYDSSVIVLNNLGVLKGTSSTKFSPNGYLTREQLAVLTKRTYNIDSESNEEYQVYTDNTLISDWATESVSACINAGVFDGLYDQGAFNPKKPVTRAEICKLIYNINVPYFEITIGDITGGTVIADADFARPGALIALTVTPSEGLEFVEGSLKYNGNAITGTAFFMPAEDVTITAEFVYKSAPTLESIG